MKISKLIGRYSKAGLRGKLPGAPGSSWQLPGAHQLQYTGASNVCRAQCTAHNARRTRLNKPTKVARFSYFRGTLLQGNFVHNCTSKAHKALRPTKVARFSYLSALVCKDTSPTTAQAMITMHCGLQRSIDFHIFQHVAACCLFLLFLFLCCCCSRNHSVPAARGLYKAEPSAQQLCELHQLAPNGRLGPVLAARCAYSCNCGSLSGRFSAGDLHARIERGKS